MLLRKKRGIPHGDSIGPTKKRARLVNRQRPAGKLPSTLALHFPLILWHRRSRAEPDSKRSSPSSALAAGLSKGSCAQPPLDLSGLFLVAIFGIGDPQRHRIPRRGIAESCRPFANCFVQTHPPRPMPSRQKILCEPPGRIAEIACSPVGASGREMRDLPCAQLRRNRDSPGSVTACLSTLA